MEPEPSTASGDLHNAVSSDSNIVDSGDLDDVSPMTSLITVQRLSLQIEIMIIAQQTQA